MSLDAEFLRAKEKIRRGTDYIDTIGVPMGDDEVEFGFRLLNESEFDPVKSAMPIEDIEMGGDGLSEDERERMEELAEQAEEDIESLSDDEKDELQELMDRSETSSILQALNDEANDALYAAGKRAILPTPEDVEAVMNADFSEQVEILGRDLAESESRRDIRQSIKKDIESMIEKQPYPVKRYVGLNAFVETMSVRGGNGLPDEA